MKRSLIEIKSRKGLWPMLRSKQYKKIHWIDLTESETTKLMIRFLKENFNKIEL
jgi:hypothetical protein